MPPPSFTYQWQRCKPGCVNIGGATAGSYTASPSDQGARIRVVVLARNTAGSAAADSKEVGPVAPAGPSRASIKALLLSVLAPSGNGAKIGALLKADGYRFSFKSPSPGRLRIDWNQPHKKGLSLPMPVGDLTVTFHKARQATVKVVLTGKGKKLLKHATSLKLTATGTFTPTGESVVTASKSFTLKK